MTPLCRPMLTLATCLVLCLAARTRVEASEPHGTNASPGPVVKHNDPPELTTELPHSDSLDLVPDRVSTPRAGGTHSLTLQRTVFRRESPLPYVSGGRRDPFRALLVDERKEGPIETELLQLDGATLSGVVWSDGVYLALVKDKSGRTFFLREGDPVYQGRLTMVTRTSAHFVVYDFGDTEEVCLKLKGRP